MSGWFAKISMEHLIPALSPWLRSCKGSAPCHQSQQSRGSVAQRRRRIPKVLTLPLPPYIQARPDRRDHFWWHSSFSSPESERSLSGCVDEQGPIHRVTNRELQLPFPDSLRLLSFHLRTSAATRRTIR